MDAARQLEVGASGMISSGPTELSTPSREPHVYCSFDSVYHGSVARAYR